MSILRIIARRTGAELVRLSALLALGGLALMAYSILVPRPLPVILAMSLGHVLGGAAVLCYLLAVLLDARRRRRSVPNSNDSLASRE